MKNMNFTPNFVVVDADAASASNTTNKNGASVNVDQADCITAVVELGTVANTATGTVRLEESDDGTTWTAVTDASISFAGSSTTTISASDDTFVVELVKPTERYARVVITKATAASAVIGGHYILGGLRYTQGASADGSFEHSNYTLTGDAKTRVKMTVGGTDADTHTNPKA